MPATPSLRVHPFTLRRETQVTQTGLKKLRHSLQTEQPDDLRKGLDVLVPQFPHLYNRDNDCTYLMDSHTGETSDYAESLTYRRSDVWWLLTVHSSIRREEVCMGPLKGLAGTQA